VPKALCRFFLRGGSQNAVVAILSEAKNLIEHCALQNDGGCFARENLDDESKAAKRLNAQPHFRLPATTVSVAENILECGGSAAAFPKRSRYKPLQREVPALYFTALRACHSEALIRGCASRSTVLRSCRRVKSGGRAAALHNGLDAVFDANAPRRITIAGDGIIPGRSKGIRVGLRLRFLDLRRKLPAARLRW